MKKLLLAVILALTLVTPVLAQTNTGAGTLPNGFPQDAPQNFDSTASYLTVTSSSVLSNYRLLSPTARFTLTDNGAQGTYVLELATVPLAYGGTGATTQTGAVDAILGFASIATGDTTYYNGTHWVRLGVGSNGRVLTVAGGVPTWAASGAAINASANFYLDAPDASMPNAGVVTAGTGITKAFIAGSTATIAVDTAVVATTSNSLTMTNKTLTAPIISAGTTTGFLMAGTSFNDTIKIADPAAARTLTIPDPGAAASFVMTKGNQTIGDTLTITNAPVLTSGTLSVSAQTVTVPAATDTLVGKATTDTLTNKTLTNAAFNGTSLTLKQTTADYTVNFVNPASARSYYVTDNTVSADFAMLNHSDVYTAGGIVYANGNTLKITAAGTSGKAVISGGSGAPTIGTLGVGGGGSGVASIVDQGLLIGAGTTTNMTVLSPGSANQTLQMNGAGTAIVWGTSAGTVTSVNGSGPSGILTWGSAVTTTGNVTATAASVAAYSVMGNNTSGSAAWAAQSMVTQQLPAGASVFGGTGGNSSVRTIPTSGTLTGEYWMIGNYATSNTITCNRCRLHVVGDVTISHAITVNTEIPGGVASIAAAIGCGGAGGGIGGGTGGTNNGGIANGAGAGGGNGGAGGYGGGASVMGAGGGVAYSYEHFLPGSGGGAGATTTTNTGSGGGAGGGALYVECTGNVVVDAAITAAGGAGVAGSGSADAGGGGGSGGTVAFICGGTWTLNAAKTISVVGGAAGSSGSGNAGGGGGGGGGKVFVRAGSTATNSGTVTVTGGAAGTKAGTGVAGGAGASGVSDIVGSIPYSVRTAP